MLTNVGALVTIHMFAASAIVSIGSTGNIE
jgi:hypothetical protein